ncbi:hypothetical protein ACOMHN_062647 [Nucella lapillus]
MASTLTVTCLVLLVLATSLLMVAFMTSHWLRIGRLNRQLVCGCRLCDCGLWYACGEDRSAGALSVSGADPLGFDPASFSGGCHWFLSPGFAAAHAPDWFKATQVMMAVAAFLSVTSLLTGLCSLRASGSYDLPRVVTLTTACTAMLLTISVSVFGGMASHQEEAAILTEGFDHLPHLAWSFWVAVTSSVLTWASAVGFFLLYCLQRRSQYVV